jgi:hypothetical protein
MDLGYTFKSVNSVKETDFVVESRIISHLIKETLSFYNQCSFFALYLSVHVLFGDQHNESALA